MQYALFAFFLITTPIFAMDVHSVEEKLAEINQQHLLKHWHTLNREQRQELATELETIDNATFREQQTVFAGRHTLPRPADVKPFTDFDSSGNIDDIARGRQIAREGAVGCLITAGGSGSRLRYDAPKGSYPLSPIKKKSLFQLFAEKVAAASKQAGTPLPLAIMTSPENDAETRAFFADHGNFGLDDGQLFFFTQGHLPYLDEEGNLFLETPNHIAMGPDGNGTTLTHFVRSGIWQQWQERGVRCINYVLIDNVLAEPFDHELIGYHDRCGSQVTLKATERIDPKEKVGTIVMSGGDVVVREYSEISDAVRYAEDNQGSLLHRCANLSLFCFDMTFVADVAEKALPWHLAHKAVKYLDAGGNTVRPQSPNAWKFEKFIFDCLPEAQRVRALLYPRNQCFAPLKNAEGSDSPETVRRSLQERDRQVLKEITGMEPPDGEIEIDPQFYYPTDDLLQRWKGKMPTHAGYIAADEAS